MVDKVNYNNVSPFKISGVERRVLKKELAGHKSSIKNFWRCHQMDKDMASFYGGSERLMNDVDAQKKYDSIVNKINKLEVELQQPK